MQDRDIKVLVTGVLGQDGANMAEYLLRLGKFKVSVKGFNVDHSIKVYGMMRRSANPNFVNAVKFKNHEDFEFVYGDLTDEVSINEAVKNINPDYFINFAANSFVACSWDMPMQVFDVNTLGILRCLEAIRKYAPTCRFYSAGSSEEFGDVDYCPQDIAHPLKPRSPYGASKCSARHIVKVYRESYDLYAIHGTLFNHEGTKRGEEFVTRKITKGVARIKYSLSKEEKFDPIELGNIYSKRDWSDSEDFVEGIWLMLNQDRFIEKGQKFNKEFEERWGILKDNCAMGSGDIEDVALGIVVDNIKDYILSSGETHTIKEFVEKAFAAANIYGGWVELEGHPHETKFLLDSDGSRPLVAINPKFYRPAEVEVLQGDSTPIRQELGWKPKITFDGLIEKMVRFDLEAYAEKEKN
jgi:GDPmannose 4,6-dehydratase